MRWVMAVGVLSSVAWAQAPRAQTDAPDAAVMPADAGTSWEDVARFLAGLPVAGPSPLASLEATPAWKTHALALDAGWSKLEAQRLSKMQEWGQQELAPRITVTRPVVYLFGGPDLISVDVLYPDATVYVLCGLEPPGVLPPLEELPREELERGLQNLRETLRTTFNLSYFVTSSMGPDLKKTQLRGVLPVLLLFLARHGDRVIDVTPLFLDRAGVPQVGVASAGGAPGVRLHFLRGGVGPVRELDYFALDLENDALAAHPGLFPFLEGLGSVNAFLKAASFILHDRHFSTAREYLLANAASLLQDDSGVPYRFLAARRWELVFFGEYTPNKKVFEDHFQTDMKKAWDHASRRPLPFSTGYPHERGSNLTLALRPDAADAGARR